MRNKTYDDIISFLINLQYNKIRYYNKFEDFVRLENTINILSGLGYEYELLQLHIECSYNINILNVYNYEYVCTECKGISDNSKREKYCTTITNCCKCKGKGKLDWIDGIKNPRNH